MPKIKVNKEMFIKGKRVKKDKTVEVSCDDARYLCGNGRAKNLDKVKSGDNGGLTTKSAGASVAGDK